MPLFEIEGVTSTDKTFCVTCIFGGGEGGYYTWALGTLKVLINESCLPSVILTNSEKTLIKSIGNVFPKTTHMLYIWRINKNIMANCKKLFNTNKM